MLRLVLCAWGGLWLSSAQQWRDLGAGCCAANPRPLLNAYIARGHELDACKSKCTDFGPNCGYIEHGWITSNGKPSSWCTVFPPDANCSALNVGGKGSKSCQGQGNGDRGVRTHAYCSPLDSGGKGSGPCQGQDSDPNAMTETEAEAVDIDEADAIETEAKETETDTKATGTEAKVTETQAEVIGTEAKVTETDAKVTGTEAKATDFEAKGTETEALANPKCTCNSLSCMESVNMVRVELVDGSESSQPGVALANGKSVYGVAYTAVVSMCSNCKQCLSPPAE